jgi:hypothetical protein
MPVEIQIIFQEEDIIGIIAQALLECQIGASGLPEPVINASTLIQLHSNGRVCPISSAKTLQCSPAYHPSLNARNHDRPDSERFCFRPCSGQRSQFFHRIGSNCSIPEPPQLGQVLAALILEPKSLHSFVAKQTPFVEIAMLKDSPALEIVLAHGCFQPVDGF